MRPDPAGPGDRGRCCMVIYMEVCLRDADLRKYTVKETNRFEKPERRSLRKGPGASGSKSRFQKAVKVFAELIYPSDIYCIGCGKPLDPGCLYSMCEDCIMNISWANGRVCEICGKPLEEWYPDSVCAECRGEKRSFSGGVTCFVYRSVVRDMIRRLKYGGESYLGRIMGEILAESAAARGYAPDLIVPVPMHYKKKKSRGYDQAELIAAAAAERLGVECCADALGRKRQTRPMSRLNRQERRHNLEDAFAVTVKGVKAVRGKTVMLVDDIYTTGTTMDCCAEALLDAGAAEVYAASMASGINQRKIPDSDVYFHDPDGPEETVELRRYADSSGSGRTPAARI